jgi:hypothetical protein
MSRPGDRFDAFRRLHHARTDTFWLAGDAEVQRLISADDRD